MNTACGMCLVGFFRVVVILSVFCTPSYALSKMESGSTEWVTEEVSAHNLSRIIFYSKSAQKDVSFHIYVPSSYHVDNKRHFPVIYWLHGHEKNTHYIGRISQYFDVAIKEKNIPEVIIVFPNGMFESMWIDSKDGKIPMESVIIKDLLPYIDTNFRTIPLRTGRIIEGFSMGGYGAARLGIKYNEMFSAISMLGAGPMQIVFNKETGPQNLAEDRARILRDVYGNDQKYFFTTSPANLAKEYAEELRSSSKIRIVVGSKDIMKIANKRFSSHLTSLNIKHDYYLIPDAVHNPIELFDGLGEENWRFYQEAFQNAGSNYK